MVLITGASRGTGAGTARVLAGEGATVLVHGFVAAPTEQVVADIRSRGGRAEPIVGDICSDAGADVVAGAVRALGCDVDVLINNYGVAEGAGWFDDTAQSWHEQFDKNVVSAFRMVQRFVPGMRARGWVVWSSCRRSERRALEQTCRRTTRRRPRYRVRR